MKLKQAYTCFKAKGDFLYLFKYNKPLHQFHFRVDTERNTCSLHLFRESFTTIYILSENQINLSKCRRLLYVVSYKHPYSLVKENHSNQKVAVIPGSTKGFISNVKVGSPDRLLLYGTVYSLLVAVHLFSLKDRRRFHKICGGSISKITIIGKFIFVFGNNKNIVICKKTLQVRSHFSRFWENLIIDHVFKFQNEKVRDNLRRYHVLFTKKNKGMLNQLKFDKEE